MTRPQLAEFVRRMGPDSVAIIPAAREALRSNDTEYRFRQDSDFYYLTGFNEPDAVAVIAPSREARYTLFVRPRDREKETWTGRRAGVEGAKERHGADEAFPVEEFDAKLMEILDGAHTLYYRLGNGNLDLDQKVIRQLAHMRALGWRKARPPQTITDPGALLHEMRLFKTDEEVALMQRSADIAAEAHREAMRAARPGAKEYEIEALIEYAFRRAGASGPAYNTIVGGGANATILHYVENSAELRDGDLLLIDAGAEYEGFASDITRTFPVNGRFARAQRDVYDLVLESQTRCIEMIKPGVTLDDMHTRSVEILTEGMARLGLLKGEPSKLIEEGEYKKFYMHRLSHYLGLDVHDVGAYHLEGGSRALEPGMVLTVEPGLYVAEDSEDIPDQYRG
ncbi:MAG TPA: aminopeptidase P N-terminal domain-containing protein, partial [Pyrinomonadaceae bacterium]|nr:aminopeptidase P N-terminal domain-containing protein [Pyrinomonadaceae bacterium]